MRARQKIALKDIKLDGTQGRCRVHELWIRSYAQDYKDGDVFPDPVLFMDHKNVLRIGDGWHRIYAALRAGLTHLWCVVKPGGKDEALLFNIAENKKHGGIPMTRGDKKHAIMLMLNNKVSKNWTNERIVAHAGCHSSQVSICRNELIANGTKFSAVRENSNGELVSMEGQQRAAESRAANRAAEFKKVGRFQHKKAGGVIRFKCPNCGWAGHIVE